MRPPMPTVLLSRRSKIALSVIVTLIVVIIALVKLSGVYINYLWFDQVGHHNVYNTIFWTRFSLFWIFGGLMSLIIGGNILLAYVVKPPFRPMSPEQQNLQHYVSMAEPRRKLILGAVMAIALLSAGAAAQGDWATWQLFFNGGSFGQKDPQFGRDISFYAFDYPVYRLLLGFGFAAVIVSIIISAGMHYLTGSIRLQTPGPKITVAARRHLTALVFVFMVFKAVAYWLDRYGFVFSTRSKFTGASYTDVHSALPAKTILFWITIVLAIGVLASIWLRSVLLPGIGFVALLIISILIGGIYPAIVQSVSVKPNASDKERPYISRNITATREAYNIVTKTATGAGASGTVTYNPNYNVAATPDPSVLTPANSTIDNVRLLDPNVISPTVLNTQKIGRPYTFSPKLNVDRYTIDGVEHDYVVAVREQATGSNLTGSQNNWINQHTVYTHGYGFVAAQADKDVTNDASLYTEGGIPPTGPLGLTQPRVYYGQLGNDFSIVGDKNEKREADGNGSANVTYTGKGGVSLSSPISKLAFALKYKDTNFLLNDAVSADGAKIIFVRNPKQRLEKVAPFLTVDGDPYPIVDKTTGHIVWMLDGYTTMANFPYSERQSLSDLTHTSLQQGQADTQINYIRNSVKATVDAYDGTVTLYQWDSKDPILKAWMKTFPGLVKPASDMPQEIRDHVRYPQDFFDVQRGLIAQYHITDPVDAYNGKGTWAPPSDPFDPAAGDQPPYYVLARAADALDDNAAQFQLTSPMVVNNSSNLAAYISATSSYEDRGQITVLQVPGKSSFLGPGQVANDLKSTPVISRDLTQFGQNQSGVVHGNLLTLPIGNSFLYVEPIYIQSSTGNSYPTLGRVFVRYGSQIGYGQTLEQALTDIRKGVDPGTTLGLSAQGTSTGGSTGTPTPGSSTTPSSTPSGSATGGASTTPPVVGSNTEAGLLRQLSTVQTQLAAAKAAGDYDKYAALLTQQSDLIAKLLKLSNGTVPAGSSATPTATPTR